MTALTTTVRRLRTTSPVDADGVRGVYLADRIDQLVVAGIDSATAQQLATTQALGWQAMIAEHPVTESLVAADGENVRGVIVLAHVVGEARILWLGVDPAQRRLGIARSLLVEALRRADESRHRTTLQVDPANGPALALYASLGFVSTHTDMDLHMVRNPRRSQA